jgi:RNA polymerase sigma-70 factor, ECF subfamily
MIDWDAIVAREGPSVWRTVYRIVGHRADAEDCFQETFLAALSVWRRESVAHPHALLQRMATARALDRLRRRYRRAARERGAADWEHLSDRGIDPSQLAESAELSARLREALGALPFRQAEAFCLFYLDGCDYQQIAAHLQGSVNAVGVLLHRARHRLKDLLTESLTQEIKPGQ